MRSVLLLQFVDVEEYNSRGCCTLFSCMRSECGVSVTGFHKYFQDPEEYRLSAIYIDLTCLCCIVQPASLTHGSCKGGLFSPMR